MPVYNHSGQQVTVMGSNGQRYAVYVMGPSGLITIDPGIAFTPSPGSYQVNDGYSASFQIRCTQAAVWTWSRSGSTAYNSTTPASGGSSTTFTTTQNPTNLSKPTSATVTVYATVGGVQYGPWTISLRANGDLA